MAATTGFRRSSGAKGSAGVPELQDKEVTPQALKDFYLKHNPERATDEDINRVLERYRGDHGKLLRNLELKYDDVPVLSPRTDIPSGSDSLTNGVAQNSAYRGGDIQNNAVAAFVQMPTKLPSQASGRVVPPARRLTMAERLRQLEIEVQGHTDAKARAEAQLAVVRPQVADLELRWNELSVISEDAINQASETQRQVSILQKALKEKDAQISQIEHAINDLTAERDSIVHINEKLEAGFDERLQREMDLKEQELVREVAALRKAIEAKDRKAKEMAAENARLEQREKTRGACIELSGAHSAIAKAFGDLSAQHPCMRLFDEPMLKLTAILFKQSIARRIFYASSLMIWLFALIHTFTSHM